jgi:hypothetical protein
LVGMAAAIRGSVRNWSVSQPVWASPVWKGHESADGHTLG